MDWISIVIATACVAVGAPSLMMAIAHGYTVLACKTWSVARHNALFVGMYSGVATICAFTAVQVFR